MGEMGKPVSLQLGQINTKSEELQETECSVILDRLNTHQETGMLEFPVVRMQFFSSGLIMVGETVSEALVLTIGRDL